MILAIDILIKDWNIALKVMFTCFLQSINYLENSVKNYLDMSKPRTLV